MCLLVGGFTRVTRDTGVSFAYGDDRGDSYDYPCPASEIRGTRQIVQPGKRT